MTRLSLLAAPAPPLAVEIAPRHVSAISVVRHGGTPLVGAHVSEALPVGAVVPGLNGANIADRAAVVAALRRVLGRLGGRPRRTALVVPDIVAKVSLVRLEKVPARAQDLDQLMRWHVRKAAPFRIEDAQVTYTPGLGLPDGGREYVLALARRDVVREYEDACREAGLHAGIVDLATFSLVNAVLADPDRPTGDWLLVHLTPECGTIVILRGDDIIFYRNRAEGSEESLADLVHQTAMYYEDRLGGSGTFARVKIAGVADGEAGGLTAVRRDIEARLHTATEGIDLGRVVAFADRIGPDADLVNRIAPLVGVLAGAGL